MTPAEGKPPRFVEAIEPGDGQHAGMPTIAPASKARLRCLPPRRGGNRVPLVGAVQGFVDAARQADAGGHEVASAYSWIGTIRTRLYLHPVTSPRLTQPRKAGRST